MISLQRKQNFTYTIKTRAHELITDVRKEKGGDDAGFNPHELLEASLAGCTAITVQMYANRKQWPLTDVQVEAKILSEGEESAIGLKINLLGDLSTEQRERLIEIAGHCPIHKLLLSKVSIKIERVQ